MDVGKLREVVTIQTIPVVVDSIGGQTEGAPVDFLANLPAAIDPLGVGTERISAGQLRGAVTKRVRIRYREDVTDDMRVVWKGRVMEIGLVELRYQERETHLYCAEAQ